MTGAEPGVVVRGLWWLLLVRGILSILFGVFALAAPASALLALVLVFGFYAVLDGVMAVVLGVRQRREQSHWGWQVVQGVVSVLAGIVAFVFPGVTVLAILLVIAAWSIVGGVTAIAQSFTMRRAGVAEWGWTLAGGVVGILFGIALLVQPGAGLLTLLWLVGAFSVVIGVLVVVWAFRLRRAAAAVGAET